MIVACRVGDEGFLHFVHELRRSGVLDREETLGWLALHGAVLRAFGLPLDDGERLDPEAFRELEERLR